MICLISLLFAVGGLASVMVVGLGSTTVMPARLGELSRAAFFLLTIIALGWFSIDAWDGMRAAQLLLPN